MLIDAIRHLIKLGHAGPIDPASAQVHALPEGLELHTLERFAAHRYRERYTMRTGSINEYVRYVMDRAAEINATDRMINTVNPSDFTARTLFDARAGEGRPGQCEDSASCVLEPLPLWAFLCHSAEREPWVISQRELIDLIRDWHEHIAGAAELAGVFGRLSIGSMRQQTHEERDTRRERSAIEKIDLAAADAPVPEQINALFVPFDGFSQREVSLSVAASFDESRDKIRLRLRVIGYHTLRLAIAEEFALMLSEHLVPTPYLGTVTPAGQR